MLTHRDLCDLNSIVQAWKDDYIYLLQSCIAPPTYDVINISWPMKLFSSDTVSIP